MLKDKVKDAIEEIGKDNVNQLCTVIGTEDTYRVIMTGDVDDDIMCVCLQVCGIIFNECLKYPMITHREEKDIVLETLNHLIDKVIDDGGLDPDGDLIANYDTNKEDDELS